MQKHKALSFLLHVTQDVLTADSTVSSNFAYKTLVQRENFSESQDGDSRALNQAQSLSEQGVFWDSTGHVRPALSLRMGWQGQTRPGVVIQQRSPPRDSELGCSGWRESVGETRNTVQSPDPTQPTEGCSRHPATRT